MYLKSIGFNCDIPIEKTMTRNLNNQRCGSYNWEIKSRGLWGIIIDEK